MSIPVQPPYQVFFDRNGQPLEGGYVWIGQPNLPPQTNQVAVYLDEALTIPAPQPLRTIAGYISSSGSPAAIYIASSKFSILVQDSNGALIYSYPDAGVVGLAVLEGGAATGNVLLSGGVGADPSWGKVGLTTHVSGVLPVANGGTGVTTSTGTGSVVLSQSPSFEEVVNVVSTDAGATDAPQVVMDRNSASPAANDELGSVIFAGRDSGAATQQYAELGAAILDPTAGSEDGAISFKTVVAGTVAERARIGQGLVVGNPTGGDKGSNSINAANIYSNGTPVAFGAWGVMTLSADQTGIVAATRVAFNTIVTNRLYRGSFSPTNNRYAVSAPAPSVLITATLTVTGLDAGDEIILTIKSGLAPPTTVIAYAIDRNDSVTNALSRTISVSRMIALDTLDVVEVWLESSVDGCNVLSGAENSRFEIWEIGAGL